MLRAPDFVVNTRYGSRYLTRWHVIPRNRFFNIYLHRFDASDDDRAFHDHPWCSISFLLRGELLEHSFKRIRRPIPWLFPVFRSAKFAHRLELVKGPVWTLFITGPRTREWGFYGENGWVHYSDFE